MKTYKTGEAARLAGVHPNTVRLYEALELIPQAQRLPNGYRVFTEFHIRQLQLVRLALRTEVLQNGLRKKIICAVRASAAMEFDAAADLTQEYLVQARQERMRAEEAIVLVRQLLKGDGEDRNPAVMMKRKEAAVYLGVSIDALRNWEMNGLICIKRKKNGYRVYTWEDLTRLKIIRTLRTAGYSLEAILRMLQQLSKDPGADIRRALNTPEADAEIITVCDRLISSLADAEANAEEILRRLKDMKQKFL